MVHLFSTSFIVVNLCNHQVNISYVRWYIILSIIYLLLDTSCVVTLSYYHVRFIASQIKTNNNILNHLSYVGKCLDCIDVRVQYIKEKFVCTVYVILTMAIRMTNIYVFLRGKIASERSNHDIYKSCIINQSLLTLVYNNLFHIFQCFSVTVFEIYITAIMYIIQQRLMLYGQGIGKYTEVNTAWSSGRGTVSHRRTSTPENRHLFFKQLYIIYKCIFNAYFNTKTFYQWFFIFEIVGLIFLISIYLLIAINDRDTVQFLLFITNSTGINIVTFFLAVGITNEFHKIHGLLNGIYYDSRFKCLQTTFERWTPEYHRFVYTGIPHSTVGIL